MVATQFARGRAVAVGVVATFLFVLIPATPAAQAQFSVSDVSVHPGEAAWTQSTFTGPGGRVQGYFIENGSFEATLHVPVYNVGPAITNVPVYYNFTGDIERSECKKVDLPQGTTNAPGKGWANFTVNTKTLAAGAHNVTITAFNASRPPGVGTADCATPIARPLGAASSCTTAGVTCRAEQTLANNEARTYLIKDKFLDLSVLGIRWCQGDATSATCNEAMRNSDGSTYNITPPADSRLLKPTFFEVLVEQLDHTRSWADPVNYGGPLGGNGDGFAYEINVSIRGPGIDGAENVTGVATTADGHNEETRTHLARSENFQLERRAGVYNVTVKLDPTGHLRRDGTNTVGKRTDQRNVEVAYRDFTGNFSAGDFRTTAANAYPYNGPDTITGNITFRNDGPASTVEDGSTVPTAIWFKVYLDNLSWTDSSEVVHQNEFFVKFGRFTPTEPMSSQVYTVSFDYSSTPTSDRYLPPGKHTIHAFIDNGTALLESNEVNNNFTLDILIQDSTKPVFSGAPRIATTPSGANTPQWRPLEPFNVYADVRDDDNNMRVVANFSHSYVDNGTTKTAYREFPAIKSAGSVANLYVAQIGEMNFFNFSAVPFNGTENWTVTMFANDSFHNNATSSAIAFRLKPWPIHYADPDYVIITPAKYPADNLSWNGQDDPTWVIRVEPNATGYIVPDGCSAVADPCFRINQQFNRSNLAYNITVTTTGKTSNQNGSYWQAQTPPSPTDPDSTSPSQPAPNCNPHPQNSGGLPTIPGGGPTTCGDTNNTFRTVFLRTNPGAAPGIWNYSIRITDIAGWTRVINGTLFLEDLRPEVNNWNLTGISTLTPPGSVRVNANLSDDNNEIANAYLNLRRIVPGDGYTMNVTLAPGVEHSDPANPGHSWFLYNQSFEVGRGKLLGAGGKYNATIVAVDPTGNWNSTGIAGDFLIQDEEAPQIGAFGVEPAVAQLGQNVTFWANATDATNVTMKLEIFRTAGSSELLMDPIFINQTGSAPFNYTYTTNFSAESVLSWRFTAIDSVNLAGVPQAGTLTVRDNLGPKYDVRSPSVVLDGTRYGSATPRIEVVVSDVEGVLASSLDLKVAGLATAFEILPAPGNLNGYLVSFDVKASKKFSHRDVVEVNLTAQDNSSEHLQSFYNFSFVVDDVAPTARLVSISPSYRDQPAHVLNISTLSRITIAAEDIDGLPTQIPDGGIRYRILGGGPGSAETVYSGPFHINDAPGVFTGPRLYQIQYWAEDDVGNFNRAFNVTTVYVDDTPPALFQFFPQGRSINATFVDDRVGVNRSVVWYRVNDQPYLPITLLEREGTWGITLPEGVKGDRIAYYLQAWDRLDNSETFGNATSPYASFDVSNHEPAIKIKTPTDGGRVSRLVELTWDASDQDGDALVFTIYYRAPGKTNFVEMAKIENTETRKYTIDTARFADGQYTLRIAAGDGGFVKLAETTVTFINRVGAIGVVTLEGDALPGSTMLIKAEVTKAEATVEARLYLGDTLVDSYRMNDEGREGDVTANDNIYSVRVPVSAAGDYRVEIYTQYREDGELKESTSSSAATFSAKLTPSYVLSEYGAIIAIIGLLAAVGIGVAVFVVMRRR